MSYKEVEDVLDPKQRQQNMTDILNALKPDETEFSTMLLGFNDIIQSTFYEYLMTQLANEPAREAAIERINKTVSEIMELLNRRSLSNPEDMVILSTIAIESISKAFVRQQDAGVRVSKQLHNLKQQAR